MRPGVRSVERVALGGMLASLLAIAVLLGSCSDDAQGADAAAAGGTGATGGLGGASGVGASGAAPGGAEDGGLVRADASVAGGGTGGVDGPDAGSGDGLCGAAADVAAPGAPVRAIASAPLDGAQLGLEEVSSWALSDLPQEQRGLTRLARRAAGFVVNSSEGLWDVPDQGARRWIATPEIELGGGTRGVLLGDLDADGDDDVLSLHVPDARGEARLLAWERGADGVLTRRGSIRVVWGLDAEPRRFALADANDDGVLDVITFVLDAPVVHLGDGAFGYTRTEAGAPGSSGNLSSVHAYDADGDGAIDLVAHFNSHEPDGGSFVSFRRGNGRGDFGESVESVLDVKTRVPGAFGDVTGDGAPDLVFGYGPQTFLAEGVAASAPPAVATGEFLPAVVIGDGLSETLLLADVDGDGVDDVVGKTPEGIRVLRSIGAGQFEVHDHAVPFGRIVDVAVTDATAGSSATLYVIIDGGCGPACDVSCAHCFLQVCVECLADEDCPDSRCVRGGVCDRCVDCDAGVADGDSG